MLCWAGAAATRPAPSPHVARRAAAWLVRLPVPRAFYTGGPAQCWEHLRPWPCSLWVAALRCPWPELGVGMQHLPWEEPGPSLRPDGPFAVDGQAGALTPPGLPSRRRKGGGPVRTGGQVPRSAGLAGGH